MNIFKHWGLVIFLFGYFTFAFVIYKHIPIANGEEFRYLRGKETLTHLLSGKFTENLIQPTPNYFLYNGYTALLVFLNSNFYYEWFHLANLIFASLIFIGTYIAVYLATKKISWALFSLIALISIPSLFAQLGFNPIDMPFAGLYLITTISYILLKNDNYSSKKILILGILIGFTQGMRQLGLGLYIILVIYDVYLRKSVLKNLFSYVLIFVVANFIMLITWPNFAINYFKNMYWYIFIGQNFYLWDYGLLFMGKILENNDRPSYYLPFLHMVTLPIYVITLFIFSISKLRSLIKSDVGFITMLVIILNYALYYILHPVLYDGTRHFLFLIPYIVILCVLYLSTVRLTKIKLVLAMITVDLIFITNYYIKTFPYSYIYYNSIFNVLKLDPHDFETDYSSTTYKLAAEWVRDYYVPDWDKLNNKLLKVYSCDNGYAVDYYSHKKFLTILNRNEADLVICDYRIMLKNTYKGETIYEAKVGKISLTNVFIPR